MARGEDQAGLEELYLDTADRVMAYCLRHTDPHNAQDVVSETFLTAWRRWSQVPDPALPWLIGTARLVLANRRRSAARQLALADRVALLDTLAAPALEVTVERRHDLLVALAAISDDEREAVLLTTWDGLSGAEAAEVLGISPGAVRVRVHRARERMAAALQSQAVPPQGLGERPRTRLSEPASKVEP